MKVKGTPASLPTSEAPTEANASANAAAKIAPKRAATPSPKAQKALGAERALKKEAPIEGSATSAVRVRASEAPRTKFSSSPEQLSLLLSSEVESAFQFAGSLKTAFTFFGGARIEKSDPFFEKGKEWGEAVLLLNAEGVKPGVVQAATASGLFSPRAIEAAKAAAIGVLAGSYGAKELGQALSMRGGSGAEALSAAAADLALREGRPEDAKLLLTLTRTGAGPGMMEAVPLGYVDARTKAAKLVPELAKAETLTTQGSRIQLPFEQETSPYIEQLREFVHFLPRRLALTEQAAGFVVFPGGFGTLNELFEVWREGRGTVLDGASFWSGFVDALKSQWTKRGMVSETEQAKAIVVDSIADGLAHLVETAPTGTQTPAQLAARAHVMVKEIQSGLEALRDLPPAVSVLGGRQLQESDAEIAIVKDAASRLTRSGIPMRIGGPGAMLEAVAEGVRKANAKMPIQAFLLESDGVDLEASVTGKADIAHVVHGAPAHKVLMYENTEAFVALPGGIGTMDEVFEIACLMQTGKIPVRPLVLVGSEFWQPILDAIEKSMFSGERKTIGENDMKLFTVTDDPTEVARLIRKQRSERESNSVKEAKS
ncbi:MAG: LOG family protein [Deltaproteobacteria bacterium]|nr:LOG family protein [Deltaproteobacteria bacterium]